MNKNVAIGLLALVVLVGGGYYLYQQSQTPPTPGEEATTNTGGENPSPTPSPSPSSASAPSVVTDSRAVPSNSTAVVTGRVTPNGAPTTYWYEYGQTSGLGARTSAQSIGSGFTAIPSPGYITGLSANTTYFFRLSAQNRLGTVNGSTSSFSTNSNPPPTGNAPTVSTNAATSISRTSALLNAHVNPRGSETTYWFEWGTDTNFGNITSFQSAGGGSASIAISASLSGLNPSTKYFFRVIAQNQFGTVVGATQSFTTSGPPSPSAPSATTRSATDVEATSATLRGTVDPNGAETTYWFEYSTDSLLGSLLLKTTPQKSAGAGQSATAVEAMVSDLNPNTTYFFRLVARNSAGTNRGDRETFRTK